MFRGLGEVGDAFDGSAVEFLDHHILDVVVANGVRRREDFGEDDNFSAIGREFILEGVVVDEALGSIFGPLGTPFLQVGAGQLHKNHAAQDEIRRRGIGEE